MSLRPQPQTGSNGRDVFFAVYSGSLPVTGIASSLSFHTYQDETGAFLTQPTIVEVGGGIYKFTPTLVPGHIVAWIIGNSGGYLPTWIFGSVRPEDFNGNMGVASPAAVVFMGTNVGNTPQAALSPSMATYESDTGTALSAPSFVEIGNGLYYFVPTFPGGVTAVNYVLNTGGSGAVTRYSGRVSLHDLYGFSPVLTPTTPTASYLTPTTPVVFTLSDANTLRGAAIIAQYAGSNTRELVWDTINGFNGFYLGAANTAVTTPSGAGPWTSIAFSILRDGGWPSNMTFYVIAFQEY